MERCLLLSRFYRREKSSGGDDNAAVSTGAASEFSLGCSSQ